MNIESSIIFHYIQCMFIIYILTGLLASAGLIAFFAGGLSLFIPFVTGANPLLVVTLWALGFAVTAFVFSIITKDYSWIDRTWSTLPVAFAWYYAYRSGCALAPCICTGLVTFWGARLTFNFARKGGYSGMEDYRWAHLRKKIANPFLWQIFNLLFISLFQSGLLVLFTFPAYSIYLYTGKSLPVIFWVPSVLAAALVCFEFTADQQQWNFHAAKKSAAKKLNYPQKYRDDVTNGFLEKGLFAFSRHPNYFGELGFWWAIWLAAFTLKPDPFTSGIFGPLLLTIVIIGSAYLTESISSSKYPGYENYKKRVSLIIPWFPKKTA